MIFDGHRHYETYLEYDLRTRLDDIVSLIVDSLPITEYRTELLDQLDTAMYIMLSECRRAMRTPQQMRIKEVEVRPRLKRNDKITPPGNRPGSRET